MPLEVLKARLGFGASWSVEDDPDHGRGVELDDLELPQKYLDGFSVIMCYL